MSQISEQLLLPKYENSPVVETVLGLQFNPLPAFTNAHLGAILECIDLGHETIVCAFRNLMDDSANQTWGLKNATDS